MEMWQEKAESINSLDKKIMKKTQKKLDNLTKPKGSLGKLEELAVKMAGITGNVYPEINKKYHIVMAGDHGVAAEGVSAFPQKVTTQMVYNFLQEGAAVNILAEQADTHLKIVDMGIKQNIDRNLLKNKNKFSPEIFEARKVNTGTQNMIQGPAMSKQEAVTSLETGIKVAQEIIQTGTDLIGIGEMGIANTTSSSAITAAVTGFPLPEVVGFGTGINTEKKQHKQKIIKKALDLNQPDPEDGIDILSKVGGFEIGGMAGVILGAAAEGVPVVIDGLISTAAVLIAYKINPRIKEYLIPSHLSEEPGHAKIYQYLDLEPMLKMNMRLGEGTGAVLAMNLVESACEILSGMSTFSDLAQLDV